MRLLLAALLALSPAALGAAPDDPVFSTRGGPSGPVLAEDGTRPEGPASGRRPRPPDRRRPDAARRPRPLRARPRGRLAARLGRDLRHDARGTRAPSRRRLEPGEPRAPRRHRGRAEEPRQPAGDARARRPAPSSSVRPPSSGSPAASTATRPRAPRPAPPSSTPSPPRARAGIEELLSSLVVVVDPCANPDGHERHVSYWRSVAGDEPDPDPHALENEPPWPSGRSNHFGVDLNRDWAWATQPETRARLAALRALPPQVYVDVHEMGPDQSYFFPPPGRARPPARPRSRPGSGSRPSERRTPRLSTRAAGASSTGRPSTSSTPPTATPGPPSAAWSG